MKINYPQKKFTIEEYLSLNYDFISKYIDCMKKKRPSYIYYIYT